MLLNNTNFIVSKLCPPPSALSSLPSPVRRILQLQTHSTRSFKIYQMFKSSFFIYASLSEIYYTKRYYGILYCVSWTSCLNKMLSRSNASDSTWLCYQCTNCAIPLPFHATSKSVYYYIVDLLTIIIIKILRGPLRLTAATEYRWGEHRRDAKWRICQYKTYTNIPFGVVFSVKISWKRRRHSTELLLCSTKGTSCAWNLYKSSKAKAKTKWKNKESLMENSFFWPKFTPNFKEFTCCFQLKIHT